MEKTTSRSISRTEDMTSASSRDETTVSTSIIDTVSDETSRRYFLEFVIMLYLFKLEC